MHLCYSAILPFRSSVALSPCSSATLTLWHSIALNSVSLQLSSSATLQLCQFPSFNSVSPQLSTPQLCNLPTSVTLQLCYSAVGHFAASLCPSAALRLHSSATLPHCHSATMGLCHPEALQLCSSATQLLRNCASLRLCHSALCNSATLQIAAVQLCACNSTTLQLGTLATLQLSNSVTL